MLLGLAAGPALAAKVWDVNVSHEDGRYSIFMRVDLATSADKAMEVFTHYPNLLQINPAIKRVEVLSETDDSSRIRTVIEICVLWLCKDVEQVQDMHRDGLRLTANVVPAQSDLRYGEAKWAVWNCVKKRSPSGTERTCLTLHAELEPDFWVPPLIGPFLMRRMLAEEAIITSRGIERLASER